VAKIVSWQLNGETFTQQHADLIAQYQPDILLLQGITPAFIDGLSNILGYAHHCFDPLVGELGLGILSHYPMGEINIYHRTRLVSPQARYIALASGMISVCNVWIHADTEQDFSVLDVLSGPLIMGVSGLQCQFDMHQFRYQCSDGSFAEKLLSERFFSGLGDAYSRFVAFNPKLRYLLRDVWPEGPLALSSVDSAQTGSAITNFILCNDHFRIVKASYEFLESCAVGVDSSLIVSELSMEGFARDTGRVSQLAPACAG